jgi:hypothetical protein
MLFNRFIYYLIGNGANIIRTSNNLLDFNYKLIIELINHILPLELKSQLYNQYS